jgi:hypothetical protein
MSKQQCVAKSWWQTSHPSELLIMIFDFLDVDFSSCSFSNCVGDGTNVMAEYWIHLYTHFFVWAFCVVFQAYRRKH